MRRAVVLLLLFAVFDLRADCSSEINVPGGRFAVQWSERIAPVYCSKLSNWLESAAGIASTVHGEFPCLDCRIEVDARRGSAGPVPWARVKRGKPTVVNFSVNPERSLERFLNDWTAVHEFSHLFIPFPGNRDIWFAEGMATYYQNILRSRAGILDMKTALRKLKEGFERGRSDDRYRYWELGQLSPRMWSTASYMRVYWSGMAYFLNVDVELRRRSNGQQSLNDMIVAFHDCCRNDPREWSAGTLARELDRLSGTEIFSSRLEEAVESHTVPDVADSWHWLGVRFEGRHPIVRSDSVTRSRRRALLGVTG